MRFCLIIAVCTISLLTGCQFIPDVSTQPLVRNPFPQLSKVAVAPFVNHSDEPTVDGRQFAMAYFAELQAIPGYEVVPLSVVEEVIISSGLRLDSPESYRRLANELGVDAIVVGSVTEFTPYYPPRCGLRVEWYAANPGYHAIPPGYGLPWGTADEEYIPESIVFEAEMALAREQMKTQAPRCVAQRLGPPAPLQAPVFDIPPPPDSKVEAASFMDDPFNTTGVEPAQLLAMDEELPPPNNTTQAPTAMPAQLLPAAESASGIPFGWPDAGGFVPPGPQMGPVACNPNSGPVMSYTRVYSGSDGELTADLADYVKFRDDARFGGWQAYLQRSDDFIRFCCHMHIRDMLRLRGGGGETRVLWQWSESR